MGRTPEGKTLTHHGALTYLWPHHRTMASAVAGGARPGEVAQAFGYTPAQISKITQSPLFLAEVARIEAGTEAQEITVRGDLHALAERSVEVLSAELERNVEEGDHWAQKTKTNVAFGVLDRSGYGSKSDAPLSLHKHTHVHVKEMTDEELYKDVIDLTEEDTSNG